MKSNKKYWKGLEEFNNTSDFVQHSKSEFPEALPVEEVLTEAGMSTATPRRGFLKALGFGLGAVTLAACNEAPIKKSIPYLIKPEEVTPGIPNFYASNYQGHGVLVKTREGRPIKIEGNPHCPISRGAADAAVQASVLDLYDVSKLKNPVLDGADSTWDAIDKFVVEQLSVAKQAGKKIRLVSSTINSPSAKSVIADFLAQYPNSKHITVDACSYTGIIKANENSFGKAVLPHYHFEHADVIVSFGADFLGTWISPSEFTKQYVSNRNDASLKNKKMSRHIQFETNMSLTGSNADVRIPVKPSEEGIVLIKLYNILTGASLSGVQKLENNPKAEKSIVLVAKELANAKGRSLVVSGSNDVSVQILVNAINAHLGSYGTTINLDNPSLQYAGNDLEFVECVSEMKRGEVGAIIFWDVNPAYDFINTEEFKTALSKVKFSISLSDREDETAEICKAVAPKHHYLESWGDANPIVGLFQIQQPTINPVYNTRAAELSILKWSGSLVEDYYHYVRTNWEKNILPMASLTWEDMLQKGVVNFGEKAATTHPFALDVSNVAQTIVARSNKLANGGLELSLYKSVALGDGKLANNPWLQELPDPVSKVTWDNFVAVAPKYAEQLELEEFDLVEIKSADNQTVTLPVLIQPGQALGTVSIAVGYGRTAAGKVGNNVGKNVYPFVNYSNGTNQYNSSVTLTKAGGSYELALTQTHHSIEGRNIIREASFGEYLKNPHAGSGHGEGHHQAYDLWNDYKKPGHNWVMAIDLNACTGCGACVVACSAENNVPVVGRDEVRRRREMHWIRIDRYYSINDEGQSVTKEDDIKDLTNLDDVSVVYQPMMCQHCDHAPCETVCPVLATVHSSDGLNHMAYNRCFGTRYCANNCPYKVRRFNWFNYWNDERFDNYLNNEFTQLVLNPDVSTRSRGVMEKCSMCIQRIQAGKLQAKIENRPLKQSDIKLACQQTCSANAIIFGDANDPESEVSKSLKSERTYYVLEELNVQPGVGYMTKVRNPLEVTHTNHHA